MAKSHARKLYTFRSRDQMKWVGEDKDGTLWIFPACDGGWGQRKPFSGNKRQLVEVDPAQARGTGWQGGAGGGRRRLGGADRGAPKVIRAAPDLWEKAIRVAVAQKLNLNEYVRRAIAAQLARDS